MHTFTYFRLSLTNLIIFASGPLVNATAIEQAVQDPSAAGRGNAAVASIDSPSAVYYNPAGLVWMDRPAVQSFTYFSRTNIRHDNVDGFSQDRYHNAATGSFFAAYPGLMDDRLALGIGLTIPHGLGIDWDADSPLASYSYEGVLAHVRVSPTVAWKVNETLSLGASLHYAYDDVEVNSAYNLGTPLDTILSFEGDGDGWGGVVALMWKPTQEWSFGVTYRTKLHTSLDVEVNNGGLISTGAGSFDYPQQVLAGLSWKPDDRWQFDFSVQWSDWSNYGRRFPGVTDDVDYSDSYMFNLGGRRHLTEQLTLNAGYLFATRSAPSRTFNPLVVDGQLHMFTVGLDYEIGNWTVSGGLIYGHRKDRTIRGAAPSELPPIVTTDGLWKTDGGTIFFGSKYEF